MIDELVALLTYTRTSSRTLLKGIDPLMVVYAESGWRVKDLIGHMTDWDMEATRSLQAFLKGESYEILDYHGLDAYNHARVKIRWDQPAEALFAEWEATHFALKDAVQAVPPEKVGDIMRFPWWASGSVRWMVRVMGAHEHEHVEEIVNAARR